MGGVSRLERQPCREGQNLFWHGLGTGLVIVTEPECRVSVS